MAYYYSISETATTALHFKGAVQLGIRWYSSQEFAAPIEFKALKVLSNDTGGGVRVVSVDRPIIC
jgi:hypothetical protein